MANKTITIALADGSTDTVTGNVMILEFGNRKLRTIVHGTRFGKTLSHYASGRRICNLRPYHVLSFRSGHVVTNREAAMLALRDLADKVGIEKAWAVIDSAPVINA